jgi:hypothetical protein
MIRKPFPKRLVIIVLLVVATGCAFQAPASKSPETATPSLPPTTTLIVNGTVQPGPALLDSVAEVQALVPFSLLVPDPTSLPDSLELSDIKWWPKDEQGLQAVDLEYRGVERSLTLTEIQLPTRMSAPEMPYQALRVRGQVAFLISPAEADNITLLWQEDQRAIFLSAEGFSVEELVGIAEGLRPAQ